MGIHSEYGNSVLRTAASTAFTDWGPSVEVDYGAGQPARIDGTVEPDIAVEIESRVAKQIRGAVLDLIFHPYPKKLLVLLSKHMHNPEVAAEQCRFALTKFVRPENFRVLTLSGHGHDPKLDTDADTVREVLRELGYRSDA